MRFGYVRETNHASTVAEQVAALQAYGVDEIYEEWAKSHQSRSSQLVQLLAQLRVGDELVMWRLDRLGRTIKQLVALAEDFERRGIHFISLKDKIDTFSGEDVPIVPFLCMLGAMEIEVLGERTAVGKHLSQESGNPAGRKPVEDSRVKEALGMYYTNEYTMAEIINATGLSRSCIYAYIKRDSESKQGE
jgi:DNA invertase Pin-like site-specific DNA recombinase